jgi:hypothetical protein
MMICTHLLLAADEVSGLSQRLVSIIHDEGEGLTSWE